MNYKETHEEKVMREKVMTKAEEPKLLALFAGSGGCSEGYHRAGFNVYGIDNDPKPLRHYPFPYVCMDALEAMDSLLRGEGLTFSNGETMYLKDFSAYHASPPCQKLSSMTRRWGRQNQHKNLIGGIRIRMKLSNKPWVIENVVGAPLKNPVLLCGSMFGLVSTDRIYHLRRHRVFETSWGLASSPAVCNHQVIDSPVYGHAGGQSKRDGLKFPGTGVWREGMGIDWMTGEELRQATPPAYTEYIGKFLLVVASRGR